MIEESTDRDLSKPDLGVIGVRDFNQVQMVLIGLMCDPNRTISDEMKWADEYSTRSRSIINRPENKHIVDLAKAGDYEAAAKLIKEQLDQEAVGDLKHAA